MLDPRLLLVAVIWGVNFAAVKYALADFSPLSFTVARFALASLFLVVVMLSGRRSLALERRDLGAVIRLGFLGITAYNLLFMYGLKFTTASNSALFISTSPLIAAVILAVTRKQPPGVLVGTGLLLSTVGVLLIIQNKPGGLAFSRLAVFGDVLTLFAAVFWALYTIQARPLLEKYSAVKITAYSMAAGTVILLPLSAVELLRQSWESISITSWAAFGFSTFLSAGVAFTFWYQGVKRIGVTRTVVYHYFVPFVAVVFASLFLHERITLLQIIGGILILLGVYLVQKQHGQA